MPSPFPGMDPWLESDLYEEFCQTLAHEVSKQLLTALRRGTLPCWPNAMFVTARQ